MTSYYNDMKLFFQKAGAFPNNTVVLHVEPDLWGYIEAAALNKGSNSGATIPASVASSGYADAHGLPNTAQGFAWALLRIRDHTAPNALLALNASVWGTRYDINSTNATPDGATLGTTAGQFLRTVGFAGNPAGISTFDLVANDITNRDSGQDNVWWDTTNTAYPNFTRYLQYLRVLGQTVGRPGILWQVSLGNQFFDTMDNSPGHTQDNKAQYILAHIPDFVNATIISVLFGTGIDGTSIFDNDKDGITNPPPISTYGCNFCNTHTSGYPDDDGGYLRLVVGEYYKNGPYPLTGGPFTPPATPVTSMATATATAIATPTATATAIVP